ncbi:partial HTH-type transcriptional regulator ImmR, partial [Gammaproteobacteria bacterium]
LAPGRLREVTSILPTSQGRALSRPPKSVIVPKKDLGTRVRSLRQQRGITQVELAQALGLTQSNVSAIERGARGITIHQVVELARVLRASTDEILGQSSQAGQKTTLPIKDRRFLRRLQMIEQLPKRDQQALLRTLDAFLAKVS